MRYYLYANILQYLINGCVIIIVMGGQTPHQHRNATGLVVGGGVAIDDNGLTSLVSSVVDEGGGGDGSDGGGDDGSNSGAWFDADRISSTSTATMMTAMARMVAANSTITTANVIDPNEQNIALNADTAPFMESSSRMDDERGEFSIEHL